MKIGIIGGGAAGFMAAITAREVFPESEVTLLEKSGKLLSKVRVSGGGRCNVTNALESPALFAKNYPRGEKQLKKAFSQFSQKDTVAWFESRGVKLKAEPDGRMFPVTDSSQTVINCLMEAARKMSVRIETLFPVEGVKRRDEGFEVFNARESAQFDRLVIATGGSPKAEGLRWVAELGHGIVSPVPSLFSFNMPDDPVRKLQGLAVAYARVRVQGQSLDSEGPLLITHWGMSGPAVLKLSAWGARLLAQANYEFNIAVSWAFPEAHIRSSLNEAIVRHPKKQVTNYNAFSLPGRLWDFLLNRAGLPATKLWGECGKKDINKLTEILMNDLYTVKGKTTFKEEFVTCGGVDLADVNSSTMESRVCPGLFFAGEVLDIDGITGGFNFQAAWTTGYIAGKNAGKK